MSDVYQEEQKETILINGIRLPLMPTDISAFSDNAILSEVYIRAPGAFAFRSKHSSSVIHFTLNLPITSSASTVLYSQQERDLWDAGTKLISSMDAYPFCFVKSDRIKSYLGDRAETSSGDLMIFGVQKITLSQDYRAPGLLIAEFSLLYNNHRALVRDFSLKSLSQSDKELLPKNPGTESSITALESFISNLSSQPQMKTEDFLQQRSEKLDEGNFQNGDINTQVKIKAPLFLPLAEPTIDGTGEVVPNIDAIPEGVDNEDIVYLKIPRPFQRSEIILNNKNFEAEEEDEKLDLIDVVDNPSILMDDYAVVYAEDVVAYNRMTNPVHSITVTKERSFASHFVGSYQHPYLQYMGRYPASLTINSAFAGNNYDESTSMPYLFKLLLGIIDANAVKYPTCNGHNFLKIETIATNLLDVTRFVPNQSQITAKSEISNMEIFSCSFIENSMDKMIKSSKVKIGKVIINSENMKMIRELITAYISNTESWLKSGKKFSTTEEENFHSNIVANLNSLVAFIKNEDSEGSERTETIIQSGASAGSVGEAWAGVGQATGVTGVTYHAKAASKGILHLSYDVASNGIIDIPAGLNTSKPMKIKDEVLADLANMMINAKKRGVNLQIISAFRDISYVKSLWGSDTPESNPDRLKTLAPPGFSEHHTGYVVDFNSTNSAWWRSAEGIKIQNWLKANASYYNFEQSFTSEYSKTYGVSEEAWHWRWVGSSKAKIALRKNIKLPEKVNNVFPPPVGKTEAVSRLTLEGVKAMTDAGAAITLIDKAFGKSENETTNSGTVDLSKAKEIIPLLETREEINRSRSKDEGITSEVDSNGFKFNINTENSLKGVANMIDMASSFNYPSMQWVKTMSPTTSNLAEASKLNDNWLNSFIGSSYYDLNLEEVSISNEKDNKALRRIEPTFFLNIDPVVSRETFETGYKIMNTDAIRALRQKAAGEGSHGEAQGELETEGVNDGFTGIRGYVTEGERNLKEQRYVQIEAQKRMDAYRAHGAAGGASGLGVNYQGVDWDATLSKAVGSLGGSANSKIGLGYPPTVRAFMDFISRMEGTHEALKGFGYDDYYAHYKTPRNFSGGQPHPNDNSRGSTAAGRYQFMGWAARHSDTWRRIWGGKNLPMTPENQDKGLMKLLEYREVKDAVIAGDWNKMFNTTKTIKTSTGSANRSTISYEWASVPSFPTSTAGAYKGQTKGLTREQCITMLTELQKLYSGNTQAVVQDAKNPENKKNIGTSPEVVSVKMPDGKTKTAKALTYSVYKITPPNVGNNAERAESVLEKGLNYNVIFLAASTGSTFFAQGKNYKYELALAYVKAPKPSTKELSWKVDAKQNKIINSGSIQTIDGEYYGTNSAVALQNYLKAHKSQSIKLAGGSNSKATSYVICKNADNGVDPAEYLLKEGHLLIDEKTFPSLQKSDPAKAQAYKKAQDFAKANVKGFWKYNVLKGNSFVPIDKNSPNGVPVEGEPLSTAGQSGSKMSTAAEQIGLNKDINREANKVTVKANTSKYNYYGDSIAQLFKSKNNGKGPSKTGAPFDGNSDGTRIGPNLSSQLRDGQKRQDLFISTGLSFQPSNNALSRVVAQLPELVKSKSPNSVVIIGVANNLVYGTGWKSDGTPSAVVDGKSFASKVNSQLSALCSKNGWTFLGGFTARKETIGGLDVYMNPTESELSRIFSASSGVTMTGKPVDSNNKVLDQSVAAKLTLPVDSKPMKAAQAAVGGLTIERDETRKIIGSKSERKGLSKCAMYVSIALTAAGYPDIRSSDKKAYKYHTEGVMEKLGFKRIAINTPWQIGDVAVMQKGGSVTEAGHIDIWTGEEKGWVSDYYQYKPNLGHNPYVYASLSPKNIALYRDAQYLNGATVVSGNSGWDDGNNVAKGPLTAGSVESGMAAPTDPSGLMPLPSLADMSIEEIQGHSYAEVDLSEDPIASVYNYDLKKEKHLDKLLSNFNHGLNICFPVVKAYVVVGNEDDDYFVDGLPLNSAAYYELPPIQNFHLTTNNDFNPLDVCTFSVINPSGMRSALEDHLDIALEDTTQWGTQYFSPRILEKLKLKAGMKIHIRGGYSNDPNKLVTMFNGVVKETSGTMERVIECVCQSYSAELLSNYVGPVKPIDFSGDHHASTGLIIGYALLMDNINHFGATMGKFQLAKAWLGSLVSAPFDLLAGNVNNPLSVISTIAAGAVVGGSLGFLFGSVPGALAGARLGTYIAGIGNVATMTYSAATKTEDGLTYQASTNIQDNILAGKGRRGDFRDPENKALVSPISGGNFLWNAINVSRANLSQRIYTNIFSDSIEQVHGVFKEDTWSRYSQITSFDIKVYYRFFVHKSTSWMILKEMEYRHPGTLMKPLWYEERQSMFFGTKEQLYIARDLDPTYMNMVAYRARFKDPAHPFIKSYLSERKKRLEPATGFHLLNSRVNILSNNIKLDRSFATKVTSVFYESKIKDTNETEENSSETIVLDRTLAKMDIKEKVISMGGCHGNYLALLYATQELKKEIETMYGGKIVVTGNPNIRAGDYAYLEDLDRGMSGIIKVRECTHHFSANTGYTTEITPGLYAEATHFFWDDFFLELGAISKMVSTKINIEQTVGVVGNEIASQYEDILKLIQNYKNPTMADFMYMYAGYSIVLGMTGYGLANMLKRMGGTSNILSKVKTAVKGTNIFRMTMSSDLSKIWTNRKRIGVSEAIAKNLRLSIRASSGRAGMVRFDNMIAKSKTWSLNLKGKVKSPFVKIGNVVSKFAGKSSTLRVIGSTVLRIPIIGSSISVLGLGVGLAAMAVMAAVGYGWFTSITRKMKLSNNAITFFPLEYRGKAYTAGILGFSNKTMLEADYYNLKKNLRILKNSSNSLSVQGGGLHNNRLQLAADGLDAMIAVEEFIGDTVYNTGLRIEATPGKVKPDNTRSQKQITEDINKVNAAIVQGQTQGQPK